MLAAKRGPADAVRALAELGADLEATDEDGRTAMMFAAFKGHVDAVRALAELGANFRGDG